MALPGFWLLVIFSFQHDPLHRNTFINRKKKVFYGCASEGQDSACPAKLVAGASGRARGPIRLLDPCTQRDDANSPGSCRGAGACAAPSRDGGAKAAQSGYRPCWDTRCSHRQGAPSLQVPVPSTQPCSVPGWQHSPSLWSPVNPSPGSARLAHAATPEPPSKAGSVTQEKH